jgi:hypothetical protein
MDGRLKQLSGYAACHVSVLTAIDELNFLVLPELLKSFH